MNAKKIGKIFSGLFYAVIIGAILLLVAAMLPIPGNYRVLMVMSGSMEQAIKTGSAVIVAPQSDYRIGDVVTFGEISKTKVPTTHRIQDIKIAASEPVYITKGDANAAPDSKEVPKSAVAGKVMFAIPYLGYALNFVKQPFGFALAVIFPAVIVIAGEFMKITKELNKGAQKA